MSINDIIHVMSLIVSKREKFLEVGKLNTGFGFSKKLLPSIKTYKFAKIFFHRDIIVTLKISL